MRSIRRRRKRLPEGSGRRPVDSGLLLPPGGRGRGNADDRRLEPVAAEILLPRLRATGIHTSAPGVVALRYPNRRPGLRAQPRFSRQPRQSDQLSTGCGGIESQGWVPAFAGTPKGGQSAHATRPPGAIGCTPTRNAVHAVALAGEAGWGAASAPSEAAAREPPCVTSAAFDVTAGEARQRPVTPRDPPPAPPAGREGG